jgi:hypothetical protein
MKSGDKINLRLPTLEELTEWLDLDLERHNWSKITYDNICKNELLFKHLNSDNIHCYNNRGHSFLIPLCCLVDETTDNDYLINTTRSITL